MSWITIFEQSARSSTVEAIWSMRWASAWFVATISRSLPNGAHDRDVHRHGALAFQNRASMATPGSVNAQGAAAAAPGLLS
jgi:hypothetical protein